jgi:hypothetical protein
MDPVIGAGGLGVTGDHGQCEGTAGRQVTAPGRTKEAAMYLHELVIKAGKTSCSTRRHRNAKRGEALV